MRRDYAGLHQLKMCRFRPDRLLRGNALPAVQVGFKVHFAGEREHIVTETRSQRRFRAVGAKTNYFPISSFHKSGCTLMNSRII